MYILQENTFIISSTVSRHIGQLRKSRLRRLSIAAEQFSQTHRCRQGSRSTVLAPSWQTQQRAESSRDFLCICCSLLTCVLSLVALYSNCPIQNAKSSSEACSNWVAEMSRAFSTLWRRDGVSCFTSQLSSLSSRSTRSATERR